MINGNMIVDPNKGLSDIKYNNLNLPYSITKGANKLRGKTKYYLGNFVYTDDKLDYMICSEGLLNINSTTKESNYEFHLKDHLGNTRVAVNESNTITQENNYYPFGLTFAQSGSSTNKYLYNGKELQEETGFIDFGARQLDKELGRWFNIDPLAEKYYQWSTYNYVMNNPIILIDPNGKEVQVSSTTNKDNTKTVTFIVTVGISNRAGLKKSKLDHYTNLVTSKIEELYSGYDSKSKTTYKTIVIVDKDEKDYVINFTDGIRKTTSGGMKTVDRYKLGTNTKNGEFEKNTMQVNVYAIGSDDGIARTGAHEYGHTIGLEHPDGGEAVEISKSSPDNLMRQTTHTKGTTITKKQLNKAFKYIDKYQKVFKNKKSCSTKYTI